MRWGEESRAGNERRPYIRVRKVVAGKFRRYAGWTIKDCFVHFDIFIKDLVWKNFWGLLGFGLGIIQSFLRLVWKSERPDVIFLKGGFVGLPIGIVAKILKIPYVIHESDVVPGLANRLLMKKAEVVAMGVPFDGKAGRENWRFVGIPVAAEFKKMSEARQRKLKREFGFDEEKPLLVVTGGSQGSENINQTLRKILPELLEFTSVGLVAGRKLYEEMVDLKSYENWEEAELKSDFRMWNFNPKMNELMGAADVVVSRAGATTIAELAALGKATILVPFERLPGGHQVKNAERLEELSAALVILDSKMMKDEGQSLVRMVRDLVKDEKKREELASNLKAMANLRSSENLAEILIEVARR